MNKLSIFIYGAGGHAKIVADSVRSIDEFELTFLIDDNENTRNTKVLNYKCIGGREELIAQRNNVDAGIVAIGNNQVRLKVAEWLVKNDFKLTTVVHPSAYVSSDVDIECGSMIMPSAVINPDVKINKNVIINSNAVIEHDCEIHSGVHVAPSSTLCGGVVVEKNVFIGAGSVILSGVRVGEGSVVGANSTVINDVPSGKIVVGSPARVVKNNE